MTTTTSLTYQRSIRSAAILDLIDRCLADYDAHHPNRPRPRRVGT
jgi:hypothetical protein